MTKFALLIQILKAFGPVILQALLDALKNQPAAEPGVGAGQYGADAPGASAEAVHLDCTRKEFEKECNKAGCNMEDVKAAADKLEA